MKTPASGSGLMALSVLTFAGIGWAAPLPQATEFSTAPLKVPSLGLLDQSTPKIMPDYAPVIFEGIPKYRSSTSQSPVDRMPIAKPKMGIDYALIVRAPDPKIDYKMLLRETEPQPTSAPKP
jgi:hypothetical protein